MLPWCKTEAMTLHLAEISARVALGRHAALLVDQAGWRLSERLVLPANITIVPLPAKCPELNPQENVWQFMRDKLAVEPGFHLIHQYRRPLLLRLGQARRPTVDHHVHRIARLGGAGVLISERRYKSNLFETTRSFVGRVHGITRSRVSRVHYGASVGHVRQRGGNCGVG